VGCKGIARDISARKGAEEALKEVEEKFRSIVETTNEWIWAIDLEGTYLYESGRRKNSRYTPERFLAQCKCFSFTMKDGSEVEKAAAAMDQ